MKARPRREGVRDRLVAVITGTGLRDLFPVKGQQVVITEYGAVTLYRCAAGSTEFLLLPRHGRDHSVPPHRINFKANMMALRKTGARSVIATSAVGCISKRLAVGGLGLVDQFIDLSSRHLTFFDTKPVHVDMTRPYDSGLQRLIAALAKEIHERLVSGLVYVSVDGPRYETAAEIRMFAQLGGDVVGMTGASEAVLANELGIRYASIVVGTNWAAGIQERISHEEVEEVMGRTGPRIKRLLELSAESAYRI